MLLRALPFEYSVALSGRCNLWGGKGSATQGGALGYVLLPLRGDYTFQGGVHSVFMWEMRKTSGEWK